MIATRKMETFHGTDKVMTRQIRSSGISVSSQCRGIIFKSSNSKDTGERGIDGLPEPLSVPENATLQL